MPATLELPVKPAVETPIAPAPPAPDPVASEVSEEARGILSNIFALGDEQAEKIREKTKADKAAAAKPTELPKVEAPPATTEAPAVATTETEKPKGKPRKAAPPAVDPVDLAVQTARETAKAMGAELGASLLKNQERREAARTETPAVETLTPKQRKKHEVFVEMAKLQPDVYADLPSEHLNSIKAEDAYKLEWVKQNPGKRFNDTDEEHDSFFNSVVPVYDEDDYADTRTAIKTRPLEEKLKSTEKLAEKLTKIEEAEEVRRVEPVASQAGMTAAVEVLRQIDPTLPDKLKTPEAVKAAQEADPDMHEIVVTHARRASELVGMGVKILESGGKGIDFNSPSVKDFTSAKDSIERQIKALPREDQLDLEGRRFATWNEYASMPEADRERHWFLDQKNLAAAIPAAEGHVARQKIAALTDGFDKRAAARGYVKVPAVSQVTHTNGAPKEDPKPAAKPPESPSAQAGKVQVSTTKTEDGKEIKEWTRNLLGYFNGIHS